MMPKRIKLIMNCTIICPFDKGNYPKDWTLGAIMNTECAQFKDDPEIYLGADFGTKEIKVTGEFLDE